MNTTSCALVRCSMLLRRYYSSSGGGSGRIACGSGGDGGRRRACAAAAATTRGGSVATAATAPQSALLPLLLPVQRPQQQQLLARAVVAQTASSWNGVCVRVHAFAFASRATTRTAPVAAAAAATAAPQRGGGSSPPANLPLTATGRVVAAEANFVRVDVHRCGPPSLPVAGELAAAAAALQQHEQQQQQQQQQQEEQQKQHLDISSSSSSSTQSADHQSQQQPPPPPRRQLLCTMRALLKKVRQRVLVGDVVSVAGIDWQGGRGVVDGVVLPRASELKDPSVANADRAVLVFGLASPPFEPVQVSRFLVAAEAAGLPVTLALNKADLAGPGEAAARVAQCAEWGYTAVPISCATGEGLEGLKAALAGATAVVAGPSGAGKSSLINALRMGRHREDDDGEEEEAALFARAASDDEDEEGEGSCNSSSWEEEEEGEAEDGDGGGSHGFAAPRYRSSSFTGVNRDRAKTAGFLAVGDVSARTGRGRHTTRVVRLLPLPGGGMVADTPGFSLPTLDGVSSTELKDLFPEFAAAIAAAPGGRCRFHNCMHVREPGCAVLAADLERHEHYLKFLDDVRAREDYERNVLGAGKRAREGATKVKTGRGGAQRAEARLESKRHRVTSRRAGKQGLLRAVDDADDDAAEGGDPLSSAPR